MKSLLSYLVLKLLSSLLRALIRLKLGSPQPSPSQTLHLPSRDPHRTIKAHLYSNSSSNHSAPDHQHATPRPILLNFHGSGFVLPLHGSDDAFCRLIARETSYAVLDIQYRLSPENPFPAALQDALDAVAWVRSQPERFDARRIALSGFSAGGNLALATSSASASASSSRSRNETEPSSPFQAVLAYYPVVDLFTAPSAKSPPPDPSGRCLPALVSWLFDRCYVRAGRDARDPRISPLFETRVQQAFPERVLIVTAAQDNLAVEAEVLGRKIQEESDEKEVVVARMQGVGHAWDKQPQALEEGSLQGDATEKAYAMGVALLSRV